MTDRTMQELLIDRLLSMDRTIMIMSQYLSEQEMLADFEQYCMSIAARVKIQTDEDYEINK